MVNSDSVDESIIGDINSSLRYQAFEKAFKQEKNTQLPGFITKFYPKLDQIQHGLNQEKTHQFKK
jgi:hypothetical protein